MFSIPNLLTFFRILLIPIFVIAFYFPHEYSHYIAAGIFVLAGVTDWFDGFLARKLDQSSRFGAFLDPVADKLLVAVALVLLVGAFHSIWMTLPAMVIVCREIAISALREWMAEIGDAHLVKVNMWGKAKTLVQMGAITVLISQPADWHNVLVWIGVVALYVAAGLTVWSMLTYLQSAWAQIRRSDQKI